MWRGTAIDGELVAGRFHSTMAARHGSLTPAVYHAGVTIRMRDDAGPYLAAVPFLPYCRLGRLVTHAKNSPLKPQ